MPSKPSVYWDACVFIDWMKRNRADRLALIEPVVQCALSDGVIIVTSAWTLVEVVRTDDGVIRSPEEEKKIIDFFKNDYIEVRPVTRAVGEKSRELQRAAAGAGMSMPKADSVHIATALLGFVPELHSFDDQHLTPHDNRWGNPKLRIGKPCLPGHLVEPPLNLFSTVKP